jgi:peptide/nickel transport system permease protein
VLRVLLRQLLGLVLTLFVSSFVVFAALYLAPGDPLSFLTRGRTLTPASLADLRAQYHLDDPFPVRYWDWVTGAMSGHFGRSLIFRGDVTALITPRVLTTVLLVLYASVLIVVSGVLLGGLSALRGRTTAAVVTGVTTLGLAVPSFVAAIVLIAVFGVGLGWFPVYGAGGNLPDRLYHLTLPAVALAIAGSAFVARITKTAVREAAGKEYVETARTRGLSERHVLRRHVFRNALIPITTVTGVTVASLIAGTVIVEPAFGINGLGSLLVTSVQEHDFPVVQAVCLLLVSAFVAINVAVDLLYSVLDPRVRLAKAAP